MERCAADDDEVDECFLLRRFEDEECEALIPALLFVALSLQLRDLRAFDLRDELGSATSRETTRRSFRRPLLDCGGGALDTTGFDRERSASGSMIVFLCFI